MTLALVTGASGFLGSAIVRLLCAQGVQVKALQRSHSEQLKRLGVDVISTDISDRCRVIEAAKNCQVVFHVAAKAGVWGDYKTYYQSNVVGTQNILDACQIHGIDKLIYTSTPSVVFVGKHQQGINELAPYAKTFFTAYQQTKVLAEKMVLAANSCHLATIALRPHLIWGPGDPHLLPRIIQRAKAGRLWLIGKPHHLIDHTYIDNAALAHILAAAALSTESACAGKAYFISNDEPISMATFINQMLSAAGLPAVRKTMPAQLAYILGLSMEVLYKCLRLQQEPPLTRFVVKQLASAHYYDLTAAKQDIAYCPTITFAQGMERLKQSLHSVNV